MMLDFITAEYNFPKKKKKVTPSIIKINNLEQDIIVLSDLHGRNQLHCSALRMYMLTLIPRQNVYVGVQSVS